jgi:hypothetical protein
MTLKFELDDDEIIALMQCASAGAPRSEILLGANAADGADFQKIQAQFSEQRPLPQPGNGAHAVATGWPLAR